MKQISKICLEVIPHKDQRYETVGDYYRDGDGNLVIKVSDLGDNKKELLVMVHELIEVILTEESGVSEESITKFDIEFEKNRKPGNLDEPGDDPDSPYRVQHAIATSVERMMCALIGVDWKQYEKTCNQIGDNDMPYTIKKGKGSKPYKIIKKSTGETVGSSTTKSKAKASVRARMSKD
jgi:hypothetical protein